MPGDSEPVTLWILCEHGEAKPHEWSEAVPSQWVAGFFFESQEVCPGGCPPTDEELIEELVKRDVLDIEKVTYPDFYFRYVTRQKVSDDR